MAGRISPEVAIARLLLGGATAESLADEVAARDPNGRRRRATAQVGRPWQDAVERRTAGAERPRRGDSGERQRPYVAGQRRRDQPGWPRSSTARSPTLQRPASRFIRSPTRPSWRRRRRRSWRWIEAEGLLDADADVVDVGCGIGRICAALAPRCRSVLGLDISAGMIAEARRRCMADLANVRFEQTSGSGLESLPTAGLDLILAVDSFPYIVQVGGHRGRRPSGRGQPGAPARRASGDPKPVLSSGPRRGPGGRPALG